MKPGLKDLTDSFQAGQPELLQQVKLMMAELERISVLSIEQWHITLLDLQVGSSKRHIISLHFLGTCISSWSRLHNESIQQTLKLLLTESPALLWLMHCTRRCTIKDFDCAAECSAFDKPNCTFGHQVCKPNRNMGCSLSINFLSKYNMVSLLGSGNL